MHENMSWGWFVYVFQISQILFAFGAIWLIVDAARKVRRDDDVRLRKEKRRNVPLITYQILAGVALILHLMSYLPFLPNIVSMISLLASPALLFLFFAYLLNVVFFKKTEAEAELVLSEQKAKREALKRAKAGAKAGGADSANLNSESDSPFDIDLTFDIDSPFEIEEHK